MVIGHGEIQKDFEKLFRRGRLGQAYIFFGLPGVGKRSFALELAAFLENGRWPAEASPRPLSDALLIVPAEGTIGIDAARSVKQFLSESPLISARRTAVLDNAEALTPEAQNALLKVAEEPPSAGLLILIVRDPEALMPTLRSRFQKIYFGAVPVQTVADWLGRQGVPKTRAAQAAETSAGAPGLALRLAQNEPSVAEEAARKFLRIAAPSRKEFLKSLLAPEDFNFRAFLDALIYVLAADGRQDGRLWHAVLELRALADATGLSPAIQLRNLWTLT